MALELQSVVKVQYGGVVMERKTVFSLNLMDVVKIETASWDTRQHFLMFALTGDGLQWERRCISID